MAAEAEHVGPRAEPGPGLASVASDGSLVYLPAAESSELAWFDRSGKRLNTLALRPGRYRSPAISRDGTLLAVQRFQDTISTIDIYELPSLRSLPGAIFVIGIVVDLAFTAVDRAVRSAVKVVE